MMGPLSFTCLHYISDNLSGGRLRGGTEEREDADRRQRVALKSLLDYFEDVDNDNELQ